MTEPQTVMLPAGVKHHHTSAIAESWEAWDGLTVAGGWAERSWYVDAVTRSRVPADWSGATDFHVQKGATIGGHQITVYPPHQPREEARS